MELLPNHASCKTVSALDSGCPFFGQLMTQFGAQFVLARMSATFPPSQTPQFPSQHTPRLRRHQIPQRIRRVIPAHPIQLTHTSTSCDPKPAGATRRFVFARNIFRKQLTQNNSAIMKVYATEPIATTSKPLHCKANITHPTVIFSTVSIFTHFPPNAFPFCVLVTIYTAAPPCPFRRRMLNV
jgi:hypothetical protein